MPKERPLPMPAAPALAVAPKGPSEPFHEALARILKETDTSRAFLSVELGLDVTSIAHMLKGTKFPTRARYDLLCERFPGLLRAQLPARFASEAMSAGKRAQLDRDRAKAPGKKPPSRPSPMNLAPPRPKPAIVASTTPPVPTLNVSPNVSPALTLALVGDLIDVAVLAKVAGISDQLASVLTSAGEAGMTAKEIARVFGR